MGREELKNALMEAGNKHGGHVTNGSLDEQLKVVDRLIWDVNSIPMRFVKKGFRVRHKGK